MDNIDFYPAWTVAVEARKKAAFNNEVIRFTDQVLTGVGTVDDIRPHWSGLWKNYYKTCGFNSNGKFISTLQHEVRQAIIKITKNVK